VQLRLRNAASIAVQPRAPLDPKYGESVIQITDPSGSQRPFTPLTLVEVGEAEVTIPPGEQIAAVAPVFFGADGWTFRQPGEYVVQAFWKDSGATREISSNSLRLQIIAGDGAGTRLVSNDEASLEAGKFLVWQAGDHLSQGRALLHAITREHPASTVSQHARLAEGTNLSRPFKDFSVGKVRQADPLAALGLLQQVNEAVLPGHLLLQKRLDEATSLTRLGDWTEVAHRWSQIRSDLDKDVSLTQFLQPVLQLERAMLSNPEGVIARTQARVQSGVP
jgi:hypothetical protein